MTLLGRLSFILLIATSYLFLYVPIAVLILFSFNDGPFPSPWVGFSLKWYHELFHSSVIWSAFYNSLILALSAMILSVTFSLGLVYFACTKRPIRKFTFLFYGNTVVPEVVLAIGLLSFFSLLAIPLGLIALIAGHTVLGLGYAVPIIYTSYLSRDKRIYEASLDLGATKSQTFWKIELPLLRPAILSAALLVFIMSFDDFIISYFCSGSEAQTLSLYIYSMIRSGISPVVNALSTILLALSSLLVIILCYIMMRSKLIRI